MQLTDAQRSAINHAGGNLQLIACAGSGKTEVVAQRVVHLLDPQRGGLAPANIIAFTFSLGDGVTVNGRIDLVRRIDTGAVTIVDLKSSDRTQTEEVTEMQLHTYALGYEELTGRRADQVEIYALDEGKKNTRAVDDDFIRDLKIGVSNTAAALRTNTMTAQPAANKCKRCDYIGMCAAAIRANA